MAYYNELTNVTDLRSTYLSITGTGDDTLILSLIRGVSADIARACGRQFVPRIETRYFDALRDTSGRGALMLDDDLLSVTTLTNGDTSTISASSYVTEPRNATSYHAIRLLGSSNLFWTYVTDPENAISIAGTWGYDLSWTPGTKSEWVSTDTLGAAIATTTATTCTLTTSGSLKGGQLIKIDSELIYVSSVSTTTATIVRGVNGSTAATHLISTAIYVWTLDASLEFLARECAAARYRLRNNPLAEAFVAADGTTFTTPKDVNAYINKRAREMGIVKTGAA